MKCHLSTVFTFQIVVVEISGADLAFQQKDQSSVVEKEVEQSKAQRQLKCLEDNQASFDL